MDYKELAEMCRYLSDTPSYTAFHDEMEREVICDSCKGGLCYEKVQDANWCMYEALQRAATAITDLLARAEAAEYELEQRKEYYDKMVDALAAVDSKELEEAKGKLREAEVRADEAEASLAAAVRDMEAMAATIRARSIDDTECCFLCKYDGPVEDYCPGWEGEECFRWRGT